MHTFLVNESPNQQVRMHLFLTEEKLKLIFMLLDFCPTAAFRSQGESTPTLYLQFGLRFGNKTHSSANIF